MSDAVSRDAVLDILSDEGWLGDSFRRIRALPAVQPDAAALIDALKDAHDALVSARAFIIQKHGSTNPAREDAIRKARALLSTEGQQS